MTASTFLVTGASGFLGSHIVSLLCAHGLRVVALIRRDAQRADLERLGATCRLGSLDDPAAIARALDGCDGVIHCAGGGEVTSFSEYFEKNTETTRRLIQAIDLARAPIQRFVLISSLSAHGPSPDGLPRPEDAPPSPVSTYGRSKLAAERLLLARQHDWPVSILRPPAIYGPGDRRWLPLFRGSARGVIPLLAGHRSASIVSGDDCARAVLHLVTHDHPSGWTGCVEDGQPLLWTAIAAAIAQATGTSPRILPVPAALLGAASQLNQWRAALSRRPTPFNSDKFQDMRQPHWVCRAQRLRDLGWQPSLSFPDGARLTAQWYRERGWM
jgi:nucleoside-diphosphate-sugar epimerase